MERRLAIIAMVLAAGCGRSSPPVASVPSGGACPEAYFAVSEDPPVCTSRDGCVQIYQVTADCTVTLRNTIEGASGIVAWPNVRAELVLYEVLVPTSGKPGEAPMPGTMLHQLVIASPLTTRTATPAWRDITFGESDPEGAIDWDFVSDDQHAYAIGCADWEQGEEEWTCSVIEYLRADGRRIDTAPVPQFARGFAAGPIADGVALVEEGTTLMCKSGDELTELTSIVGEIVATALRYGDRYFLYREDPGTRTSPASALTVTPMKGCQSDPSASGWFIPGPGGLVGHAATVAEDEESRMRIYLKDTPEPLSTADGKPFETAGLIAWAAP